MTIEDAITGPCDRAFIPSPGENNEMVCEFCGCKLIEHGRHKKRLSDVDDLVRRLREAHPHSPQYLNGSMILAEAADQLERQAIALREHGVAWFK